MPWGVAAAVIGGGAAIYGGYQQSKATGEAAKGAQEASQRAIDIQEERFEEGRAALQPYAAQEQAASLQLMAQMGIAPPPGAADRGGGAFGFGAPVMGEAPSEQAASRIMEDLITQQMAINARAGIGLDARNIADASNKAREHIRQMKASGQLPADFPELSQAEWSEIGYQQRQVHGGMKSIRRDFAKDVGDTPDLAALAQTYYPGGQAPSDVTTQQMGPGAMIDPRTGLPVPRLEGGAEGAPLMGADTGMPAPQTAQDIMRRAGIEGLPPEIQQQYLRELAQDPQSDPELAAYLGLTPESLEVGAAYQETPAYAAAREAGIEAVEAGAAGTGTLYSGRRGKALRDVGQDVEQRYYESALQRRQQMMGARRGQRAEDIGRRGREYGAERGREQSYYNNYMTMLNQLASPTTTTNIAAMGTNIGQATAANLVSTARDVGNLQMGGAAVQAGMYGDIAGGMGELAQTMIDRPSGTTPNYLPTAEQQPMMALAPAPQVDGSYI